MSEVKVDIKVDLHGLADKLDSIQEDDEAMLEINNILARYCDPYVPYLNGPLSRDVEVSPHGVLYVQPYARRQYYGDNFRHTVDTHPLASARWDEAMMRDHEYEFLDEVEQVILKRLNS